MFKLSDSSPDGRKQRVRGLAAVAGLALIATGMLLQLPHGAAAGVAPADGDRNPSAGPSPKPPGTYQLRCWQYGRLLFDEGPVTLGPDARQGGRLVAIDRHGGSLILTAAGETTCLARPFPAAPNLALPR